jgi:hypothetical protein
LSCTDRALDLRVSTKLVTVRLMLSNYTFLRGVDTKLGCFWVLDPAEALEYDPTASHEVFVDVRSRLPGRNGFELRMRASRGMVDLANGEPGVSEHYSSAIAPRLLDAPIDKIVGVFGLLGSPTDDISFGLHGTTSIGINDRVTTSYSVRRIGSFEGFVATHVVKRNGCLFIRTLENGFQVDVDKPKRKGHMRS